MGARERKSVCVCVCERKRERERFRERDTVFVALVTETCNFVDDRVESKRSEVK